MPYLAGLFCRTLNAVFLPTGGPQMVLVRAQRVPTLAFLVCLACVAFFSVSPAAAVCGDSVIQAGEDCDDGGNNGTLNSCCTTSCTFSGESPDVIVGEITTPSRWGTLTAHYRHETIQRVRDAPHELQRTDRAG